ncbi:granule-associated protein [Collimonas arenae]|uniref:Granule-associated protein n=1 Tax=Collimonas arenae TaxID=279058 RepID=A0A0A1F993_9BURK|nr:phasin family protein [Collimonas arenae]AIY41106.1 granule-associated protein [Collimonas arenae]
MSTVAEQFSAATKANFEANLASYADFTAKVFAGMEKLTDLNLSIAKASLKESTDITQKLFSAKDPQEFFSLSAALAQPNTERSVAYSRHFASIVSDTRAALIKVTEAQIAEARQKVIKFVDQVTENMPSGTESTFAFFKTAISNTNAGYEQLSKSATQAVEAIESNAAGVVDHLSQATTHGATRSVKK